MAEPQSYFELFADDENRVSYKQGESVFKQGDVGKHLYVVTAGTVALLAGGSVVETIERGGVFGELALVDGGPRSTAAMAATDCELVSMGDVRFAKYVARVPFFGIEVMRAMARRLRRQTVTRL